MLEAIAVDLDGRDGRGTVGKVERLEIGVSSGLDQHLHTRGPVRGSQRGLVV